MLNLHHLLIFHAVAEAKSVSGGADCLMISQPAVSKQLRQMERQLKNRLFERHARGVELTASGQVLADYSRRIFALLDDAGQAMEDLTSHKRGSLSIGAGPTVGVYLIPAAMVRFRREYPAISLHCETENAELLRQRLLDGRIESAITESPLVSVELESKVLFEDVLVPVVNIGHALSKTKSVSAEVFCQQPFIARQVQIDARSLVERTLADRGLNVQPVLTVSSTEAMKQAVIAGLGVAMISRLAIQTDVAAGLLVELKIKGLKIRYPIHHVWKKGRPPGKLAMKFLSFM